MIIKSLQWDKSFAGSYDNRISRLFLFLFLKSGIYKKGGKIMKSKFLIISIFATLFIIFGFQAGFACDCDVECRSPGYWKNHPDAWPVDVLNIGGTYYPKAEAIAIMMTEVKGDKWYTMFRSVVAGRLNQFSGCKCAWANYCVKLGQMWMAAVAGGPVPANGDAWQGTGDFYDLHGEAIYLCLDAYNNGEICIACEVD
jgi:hypothetical protein